MVLAARRLAALAVVIAALVLVAFAAGCGSSSKPAYCGDRDALQQSFDNLKSINLTSSNGVQQFRTQLQQVQSDATKLINSARSHFQPQTSALKSSLAKLQASVQAAISAPSASTISTVGTDLSTVGTDVTNLANATKSSC